MCQEETNGPAGSPEQPLLLSRYIRGIKRRSSPYRLPPPLPCPALPRHASSSSTSPRSQEGGIKTGVTCNVCLRSRDGPINFEHFTTIQCPAGLLPGTSSTGRRTGGGQGGLVYVCVSVCVFLELFTLILGKYVIQVKLLCLIISYSMRLGDLEVRNVNSCGQL